jgi:prepilin-type N-terminal cleavage/methylation domain-containing protein
MKRIRIRNAGFTLLELLVSMAIFTVVAGVALALVAEHIPLYNRQEGMTALNIGVRSAIAQMELDVVNAGTGYYVGPNRPDWPVGVTIINNTQSGGSCFDSGSNTYGPTCFDKFNVITTDLATPAATLSANVDSSATTVDVNVPTSVNPGTGSAWTAADFAAQFADDDQILLVKSDGSQLTTFQLTAAGAELTSSTIRLTHTATNADGTNGTGVGDASTECTQTDPTVVVANDPLDITRCWNSKLGAVYDADDDWVLKLAAVTYQVDASDSSNPKLVRSVGGVSQVLAEQIIGFKIGASIWNDSNGYDEYYFDSAEYPDPDPDIGVTDPDPYNFTRVRSVRVSLIGRTTPSTDPTYTFRNTFDDGAYQIQAVSMVVNPRNLSMRDQ